MSHSASDKYKEFRNYMCNELGITRHDIEAWTKEAVAVEVNKKLDKINVESLVERKAHSMIQQSVGYGLGAEIKKAVADRLAQTLVAQLTIREAPKAEGS